MSLFICTICMDLLMEPRKFALGKTESDYPAVGIYCGHLFHKFCLSTFLDSQKEKEVPISCPVCDELIDEADIVRVYFGRSSEFDDYYEVVEKRETLIHETGIIAEEIKFMKADLEEVQDLSKENEKIINKKEKEIKDLKHRIASLKQHRKPCTRKNSSLDKECKDAWMALLLEDGSARQLQASFALISDVLPKSEQNKEKGVPAHSSNNASSSDSNAEEILKKIKQILDFSYD